MHDTTWFEIHGLPALFLASTEFSDGAAKQAAMLGLPQARGIFVQHPVQGQTDDEMRAKADAVFDRVLEELTRPGDA